MPSAGTENCGPRDGRAFSDSELDIMAAAYGYTLTESRCNSLHAQLSGYILKGLWHSAECILASLINTDVNPNALVHIANSRLGALIGKIANLALCGGALFCVSMSRVLVSWWGDSLLLAQALVSERDLACDESATKKAACKTMRGLSLVVHR